MSIIVKSYTFSAGATIIAAEHNSNFDTIYADYNGNITNANISASAAIALSKISFTTALTMSGAIIKPTKGADVASTAGTITLGEDGNQFDITGTAAITSITAKTAGTFVYLQFDSTASLVDGSNLKINGNFTGAAESTITLYCDGTNWFELSRSPLSFTPSVTNALSGSVIQTLITSSSAYAAVTTVIPADDTIPQQSTEGASVMTRAITPNNASNTLEINITIVVGFSSGPSKFATCALYQDSTEGAIGAWAIYSAGTAANTFSFKHTMAAGTTSSTTFKVFIGPDAAYSLYFNGQGAARIYGGVSISNIVIKEIKA